MLRQGFVEEDTMRISELAQVADVSVPTIKYYLREGLLLPGRPTAPNQADYDDEHVRRLRLIRVLREVGGLGITQVRAVLRAVDSEMPAHAMLGVAHHALGPAFPDPPSADELVALEQVDRWLDELGWRVSVEAPSRRALARALVALRRVGRETGPEVFAPYAAWADEMASFEVSRTTTQGSRAETVAFAVAGTVVFGAAFEALRRLAQEHHSAVVAGGRRRSSTRA
jgi:DNA-binding transcriptional MerR regulator